MSCWKHKDLELGSTDIVMPCRCAKPADNTITCKLSYGPGWDWQARHVPDVCKLSNAKAVHTMPEEKWPFNMSSSEPPSTYGSTRHIQLTSGSPWLKLQYMGSRLGWRMHIMVSASFMRSACRLHA